MDGCTNQTYSLVQALVETDAGFQSVPDTNHLVLVPVHLGQRINAEQKMSFGTSRRGGVDVSVQCEMLVRV